MIESAYQTLILRESGPYKSTAAFKSATRRKIESFRSLPIGWHYGEGVPISQRSHDIGLGLLDEMLSLGLTRTDAFPGHDGELMITAYHAEHCLEVTIESDGSQHVVHEVDGEEVWASQGEGKALIRQRVRAKGILDLEWRSSGLFIANTMTAHADASLVWHSRIPQMEAEHLSSTQHAWMRSSSH